MSDDTRWFRVTFSQEWLVQATNEDEAEELFWESDVGRPGVDLDSATVLDIGECEDPVPMR